MKVRFPFPTSRNNQLRGGSGWNRIEDSLQQIAGYINDGNNELIQAVNAASAAAAQAGEYADEAFSGTPEGYDALVADVSDIKTAFNISAEFSVTGFLNPDYGTVVSNANYATTPLIDLTGIRAGIAYTVKSYSSIAIACLYNDNGDFISSIKTASSSVTEVEGIITNFNGARYIRFCSNIQSSYVPSLSIAALNNLQILGKVVDINNVTFSAHDPLTNLIDPDKCTPGYVNGTTDGSIHASTTMYVTEYIPLTAGKQYYWNGNYVYKGYYAFYNSSKEYISGGGSGSGAVYLTSPFTAPTNAAYGRFTIASADRLPNAWVCETNQMSTKPHNYAEKIFDTNIPIKPTDYKGNEIAVFNKILCIGDSLTDGAFNNSGGTRLIIRNRAYPAKLETITGIDCTNMGYAGYTAADWYAEYNDTDLSGHDACIIQLGVNDELQNVSESDFDAALTSIVTKVKTDNKDIKIFIATIPAANSYMTTAMRSRSQMIRDFVSSLNDSNVYLVDLWTYGHTDDYLPYDAGHLSALGYLRLAEDYKAYISYIIHNHISDFRYVQFIGTDYTYSGDTETRQITY